MECFQSDGTVPSSQLELNRPSSLAQMINFLALDSIWCLVQVKSFSEI